MKLSARLTDRSAKAALCRVLDERASMACTELSNYGANADLRTLRKRVKELRGLLRLTRSGLADAKALDMQLRDAAQGLSQTRDLDVMLDSLDTLTAGLRAPARFAGLRRILLDARAAQPASDLVSAQKAYRATIAALQQRVTTLSLTEKASVLIWRNAQISYRRVQRDHLRARQARRNGLDAEPFHEWRKGIKRHWYQARFLAAMKPGKMKTHISRIDHLGKTLGAHNDLDVMMGFLDATPDLSAQDAEARDILRRHVLSRRMTLARDALHHAETALAPSPEDLIEQWQCWWHHWRAQRKSV